MSNGLPVTAVIINYRTPDLLERAVGSLRQFYPTLPLLLIDNGSGDQTSVDVITAWKKQCPDHTQILLNPKNLHHGPAMDQALHHASTPFVLFLDSDCEVIMGGFVEQMVASANASPLHYAVGKRVWMDRRGFDTSVERRGAVAYIRPICMLMRRDIYPSLPKARRHGTPCLENMREAVRRGYVLVDFPITEFVLHKGRGTAARFGYGLGWRGKVNFLLHKLRL